MADPYTIDALRTLAAELIYMGWCVVGFGFLMALSVWWRNR